MSVLISEQDYKILCEHKEQLAKDKAAMEARARRMKEAEIQAQMEIDSRYNKILDNPRFCGICEIIRYRGSKEIIDLKQCPMRRPIHVGFIGLRYTIPSEEQSLLNEIKSFRYSFRGFSQEMYIVVQSPTHYDQLIEQGYRIPIEVRNKLQKEIDDEIARKKAVRKKELEAKILTAETKLRELPTLIAAYKHELETL